MFGTRKSNLIYKVQSVKFYELLLLQSSIALLVKEAN